MSGTESGSVTINQPNLSKQDLSKLDVTKLTALSPEVFSRQATINIGTIGHVAHGKSTVVKAVSGVQTVRFKNELERNITIKLEHAEAEMASSKANSIVKHSASKNDGKSVGTVVKKAGVSSIWMSYSNGALTGKNKNCSNTVANSSSGKKRKEPYSKTILQPTKKAKSHPQQKEKKKKKVAAENIEYEVEKILDYQNIRNKPMYWVKWKGWASHHNTWEPYENLKNCTRLLCEFFEGSSKESDSGLSKELETLRDTLSGTKEEQEELLEEYRNKDGWLNLPKKFNREETEMLLNSLAKLDPSRRDPHVVTRVSHELKVIALLDRRKEQLIALKKWEEEINYVNELCNSAPITIENNVDFEGPPSKLVYVTDYIPGENVVIPEEPPFGCNCNSCDRTVRTCCGRSSGSEFSYNAFGRLRVDLGTPIYECNTRCKCSANCLNRVVQKGRKIKLCIFKTNTNCGWGVKSLEKIRKGTFITVYVGEVITSEEAEKRGKVYDNDGRTYLFDLDYNKKDQCPYTVDAANYGNVSHFINHSCDPNIHVFAVWINCLDPDIPQLALFAAKEINNGDEITFDYLCRSLSSEEETDDLTETNQISNKMLCQCRSENCRKFLFFN